MTDRAPEPTTTDVHEWRSGPYAISTDRSRLDLESIHRFLSTEFWDSEGVPREVLERAIRHSICFGVYEGTRQIGFARVVTDRATFAFVSDDYVAESHRGRGLGKWLMQCILAHPELQGLRRILLVTHDPRLYLKSGFTPLKEPGGYMEIWTPDVYAAARTT